MSKEAMKLALEALVAMSPSGPTGSLIWHKQMYAITALREALAEHQAQPKYRRGDRLICLETEEYCVIHISGTDRQWVKFPDTHIGVYKNEQLAELFELLPKEIEIEQPAQQKPVAKHYVDGGHLVYPMAQRTWVGLTKTVVGNYLRRHALGDQPTFRQGFKEGVAFAEAKLKEKNR